MTIAKGEMAPDFELPSSQLTAEGKPGKKIKLSDLRGKPVVLAFYPLDFSPPCTKENICFRDDLAQFEGLGATVLGVSVDSPWAHAAFAKSLGLTFPLLADFHPKGAMGMKYGLYSEEKGFDRRATVVVDREGRVAYVEEHAEARDNAKILRALEVL